MLHGKCGSKSNILLPWICNETWVLWNQKVYTLWCLVVISNLSTYHSKSNILLTWHCIDTWILWYQKVYMIYSPTKSAIIPSSLFPSTRNRSCMVSLFSVIKKHRLNSQRFCKSRRLSASIRKDTSNLATTWYLLLGWLNSGIYSRKTVPSFDLWNILETTMKVCFTGFSLIYKIFKVCLRVGS